MIVESVILILQGTEKVAALIGDRAFPRQLPDATEFPAIVVTRVSGNSYYANGEDSQINQARIQIDCYSDRGNADVVNLKRAVYRRLSALKNYRASGNPCAIDSSRCINDTDMTESATERAGPRLTRRMLEFAIFSKELEIDA
jgi:hypothetical protein